MVRLAIFTAILCAASDARAEVGTSSSAAPVLVLARSFGAITAWSDPSSRELRRGDGVPYGASLVVSEGAELFGAAGLRVRLGAEARLTLGREAHTLESGRLWAIVPAAPGAEALVVSLGAWVIRAAPGASFVVEHLSKTAPAVVARAGLVEVEIDGERVRLAKGQLLRAADAPEGFVLASGGEGVLERARAALPQTEAHRIGLEAFLIARSADRPLGKLDARGVVDLGRVDAELVGSDGVLLFEEAVRPAPFFLDEVPSKGPNVRVELEFVE